MPDRPTYVIGHKNPDLDAICAAIGYAAFKRASGQEGYVAARCGNSNARIDAVLGRFGLPLPLFVGDVTPRVRDIMVEDVRTTSPGSTCAEALELIDRHDVRGLPVIDDERRLLGTVSIFQMGEYFVPKPADLRQMRHVRTDITAIIRSLKARVLHLCDPDETADLYVRIGAMDIRSFGRFTDDEATPPGQSIIVVGDRWDIQQMSIQMGVRLLVVTGNLEVDPKVLEMARERSVSLIVSPYDSATSSWIIRAASKLEELVDRTVHTFGADDKLAGVRRKVARANAPVFMVVDEDERLIGVFSKTDLIKPVPTRLVLVDHNEIGQAVAGADEVTIEEIIDHHRLGNQPTAQPILFLNEPVGSTSTIVADQFRRAGLAPEPPVAGALMAGLISDTLNLRSPTSTAKDEDLLAWLAGIAEVDVDDLAHLIFSSGSVILNNEPEAIIRSDMKGYREGEIAFTVSQVEELGFEGFWKRSDQILAALAAVRATEGTFFSALLVTAITTQDSLLIVDGSQELIDLVAYASPAHERIFELPGIVSRKKQLIPYLTRLLQEGHAAGALP